MRLTVNLGLVCLTAAFIGFLKYFAGPIVLQKNQQEFVLNMLVFGPRPVPPPPRNQKIVYTSPTEIVYTPLPPFPQDPDSPPPR